MYKEEATPTHNLSTQIVVNEKYISFDVHGFVRHNTNLIEDHQDSTV
jgi:hypothetical protein